MSAETLRRPEPPLRPNVAALMRESDEVVHPDHSVEEAATRMRRHALTLLPVVDGDELVGVLSADAVLCSAEKTAPETDDAGDAGEAPPKVGDLMTADFAFCYDHDDAATARAVMEEGDLACLVVVDGEGHPIGLISREAVAGTVPAGAGGGSMRRTASVGRAKADMPGAPPGYDVKPRLKR